MREAAQLLDTLTIARDGELLMEAEAKAAARRVAVGCVWDADGRVESFARLARALGATRSVRGRTGCLDGCMANE